MQAVECMLTEEQIQFAQMLERFATQEYAEALEARTFNRERYARLAAMGCLSLAVPEHLGGFGGPVEVMLAMQNLAPKLPKEPILECGVHAAALLGATLPGAEAEAVLQTIRTGSRIVVPALRENGSRYRTDMISTCVRASADGWILNGAKHLVEFAEQADGLLVTARHAQTGELFLFHVETSTSGINLKTRARIDSLPCADVEFTDCSVPATALLADSGVAAMIEAAQDRAEAAQLGQMVGLMDALIRETIGYVQTRRQFGTEIGRFQALRHRIADMWIQCEEARSLAFAAALSCDGSAEERAFTISSAKLHGSDAAKLVGNEAVQMHGGTGMTDELIVSHWFKRLLALRSSLGDRRFHLSRLIDRSCAAL